MRTVTNMPSVRFGITTIMEMHVKPECRRTVAEEIGQGAKGISGYQAVTILAQSTKKQE